MYVEQYQVSCINKTTLLRLNRQKSALYKLLYVSLKNSCHDSLEYRGLHNMPLSRLRLSKNLELARRVGIRIA